MSRNQQYNCPQYCPFSDRYPERKPAPISGAHFPLCGGNLPDNYHTQMFCIPYAEVSLRIPGLHIGLERLAFVFRNLVAQPDYYHSKVGQITEILYPAIKCSSDTFDFATFVYEGSQFALLLDSIWYMMKRTEQNLADYISHTNNGLLSEQLMKSFDEFFGKLLKKCQDRWLERASNGCHTDSENHTPNQIEVPYVFNGGSERLNDITRVPVIKTNLLSAMPSYFERLERSLNELRVTQ